MWCVVRVAVSRAGGDWDGGRLGSAGVSPASFGGVPPPSGRVSPYRAGRPGNSQARRLRYLEGFALDWPPGRRHVVRLMMQKLGPAKTMLLIPGALGLLALVTFALWFMRGSDKPLDRKSTRLNSSH